MQDSVLELNSRLSFYYHYPVEEMAWNKPWKEMSFQIKCFIVKLAFYHVASYAKELQIAAEEIIVAIMDG